jgi:pSer/pThr/pTyr-binding forkhead associated (FHA) protein
MQVLEGLQGVSEIRFPEPSFGIGRFYSPDEQILVALDDRSISRRHAFFTTEDNEFYLMDMNSSYGTSILMRSTFEDLVPGQKERVYNDDVIRFGKTVKVRLRLLGGTRAESTQL